LRILEEREVRRVGGNIVTPIDVRIIAATNKNLQELVAKNKFREDLFYRLCTIRLSIPALRERNEDILLLIKFFALKFCQRELALNTEVRDFLVSYNWPGNIRELQNVVQFMCRMVESDEKATLSDLPNYLYSPAFCTNVAVGKNEDDRTKVEELEIIKELEQKKIVLPIYYILNEFRSSNIISKGLGRQALLNNLTKKSLKYPEHKIRSWLNLLNNFGCVEVGSTRQGSKITNLGNELFFYLEEQLFNNLTI